MGNTCLKAGSGDYSKAGPYTVMTQSNVDLGSIEDLPDAGPTTYTIFYPQPFETSCLHPVVAWGNGTGVTGSSVYQFFNSNGASWGLVVIASDNSNVGSGVYHKAAIDYMAKQNADPKSIFYKHLSTRVGTSGHSQGGIGATAGADLIGSSCEAEVCVAGGGLPAKTNAFICLTGSADLAEQGCTSAYTSAPGQAFLADWDGGDHTTTETVAGYIAGQPGTIQMMRLYAAWFRCFLADDQVACKLFEGGAPSRTVASARTRAGTSSRRRCSESAPGAAAGGRARAVEDVGQERERLAPQRARETSESKETEVTDRAPVPGPSDRRAGGRRSARGRRSRSASTLRRGPNASSVKL